ncbi:Lacal_2735 family protein [Aequorivita xiaoshiensis]|uniref:Lacal_2735 family protein n=1 Tax=Aequorivita xiaoshiensis TaxID=2874476 RepID=A0A9X1R3G0_9FLAO|nr:Lacal_2735 family protein [Aequorivita xiaoshiensis]MCG2430853.1 Lacal_2735 family protein [Aequorivita xiaoshiensis]
MTNLFRKKSKLEKLEEKYTLLMKKSFETSLKDVDKSELIQSQADKIKSEIKRLSLNSHS